MHMALQQRLLVRQRPVPARAALVAIGVAGIGPGCGSLEHRRRGATPADASGSDVLGSDEGLSDGGLDSTAVGEAGGPTPSSCMAGGAGMSDCGGSREGCCTSTVVTGGT